jgi:hypothetical protein
VLRSADARAQSHGATAHRGELALESDGDATYRGVAPTNGQTSGTATITAPNFAGSYVVRVHVNGTTVVSARSAAFTVAAAP